MTQPGRSVKVAALCRCKCHVRCKYRGRNSMKRTCSLCWVSLLLTLQLFSASQKAWAQLPPAKFQVLDSFKGAEDGLSPDAGLIGDSAGNLYGTTILGGDFSCQSALGPDVGWCSSWTRPAKKQSCTVFTPDQRDRSPSRVWCGMRSAASTALLSMGATNHHATEAWTAVVGTVFKVNALRSVGYFVPQRLRTRS